MKYWILAALVLAGCGHMQVLQLGDGRYTVTGYARTGVGNARGDAIEAANDFCANHAQHAKIESFDDKTGLNPVTLASSSAIFRCE